MLRMMCQNYTIADMIEHGGGCDSALSKDVDNLLHDGGDVEQTPSLSERCHCSFAASPSFPYVKKKSWCPAEVNIKARPSGE
jgi:hypothetical protein